MRRLISGKILLAAVLLLGGVLAVGVLAQRGTLPVNTETAVPSRAIAPAPLPPQMVPGPQVGARAPSAPAVESARAQLAQPPAAQAGKAGPAGQADLTAGGAPWDRMVIRSASLVLQVEDVESALQKVRDLAHAASGFVSASQTRFERVDDKERQVATVTIQVRSEAFDGAVQALRQIALKVESESGTSQDVTEEYVDLDANLRNLRASEAALIKLLERAQRLEDVLVLQRELTNLRGQIERLEGRKRFLERRTEMATISVTLRLPPVEGARPQVKGQGWDPLASAQRGWEASLAILRRVADGLIVALAFSWWFVPFLALGAYLWRSRRGQRHASVTPQTER